LGDGNLALITKITAMRGKLLTREDYASLSRLGAVESVGNAIRSLEKYSAALGQISATGLRRSPLERRLVFSAIQDFRNIYKFVTDDKLRGLMDIFFMKYEIKIIQILLGYIYDERPNDFDPEEITLETGKLLNNKINALSKIKTVPEFINGLSGTAYFNVLSAVYKDNISLYELETQLDLFYYLKIWRAAKKNAVLKHIAGTEIDMKNIIRAYRLRRFKPEPSMIYASLIPASYKLKASELKNIAEAGAQIDDAARKYKNVFNASISPEKCFLIKISKTVNGALKYSRDAASHIFAYLFLKELEIYNLTSLTEGVRYGLTSDEIESYLCYGVR